MGLCLSVASSVHDAGHALEDDVVVCQNSSDDNTSDALTIIGSIYSHQGSKGSNQDAAILYQGYGIENGELCGVFDGHGKNGHIVSKMVRNRLPSLLLSHRLALGKISASTSPNRGSPKPSNTVNDILPNRTFCKWKEAGMSAFKTMDKEIKALETVDFSCSGTTVVVAVRQGDDLIVANLGDSRAILGTRTEDGISAIQLTTDLKPDVPAEADRIRKCNGRVLSLREEPHIQRVWLPHEDSPGLAMSRALGDFLLKNHGIIALPDVSYHHISPTDQFVVLATDGVWDVLSNDEVASIVYSTEKEEAAAKAVVDASIAAWNHKFPTSKRDDCTVVCLFLKNAQHMNKPLNTCEKQCSY